jgi:outer membrane receptor protein involved in Fe transport
VALPAGPILFAIGGQYRQEKLAAQMLIPGPTFEPRRDVAAAYLELQIPLLDRGNLALPTNRLELTLAARSEHYSDFGSTTNPKAGIVWRPIAEIKFRGTFGTSFKAPLLSDLNPALDAYVFPQPDPKTGGNTNVLILFGGNPLLNPEKATTWTLGMDLLPENVLGFRANATYFNIHFKDVITSAGAQNFPIFTNALQSAGVLGPQIVQRNPTLAFVNELIADAKQSGLYLDLTGAPGGVNAADIGAIADSRSYNFSVLDTSGIDFDLAYTTNLKIGKVESGIDGTYIIRLDEQFVPTAPVITLLNTPYNPVNLRLRARGILSNGNWTFAGLLNYVNSYKDNRGPTVVPVSSWTTVDISMQYNFAGRSGVLGGLAATLSVLNIANEAPPVVANASPSVVPGINFDGTNANALGRFISLQLVKRW